MPRSDSSLRWALAAAAGAAVLMLVHTGLEARWPGAGAWGVAALILAAAAVGAWLGWLRQRAVGGLRGAIARWAAGELSTPARVPVTPGLRGLAADLDRMRGRLRELTADLAQREEEAQSILGGIVEGVYAVDHARRFQYLNPQAAALLGVDPREVVGRFCGDVLRPAPVAGERPCEAHCPIVHARSRGASRAVEHLELAGGRRTVVITSSPSSGRRQVQVLRDETEVEAARRSRDAVLANVTHELRTPLAAQLASIELLRDGLAGMAPEDGATLVAALERSTLRLTRLIDNLLASVRIETGRAELRREPLRLATVVEDAVTIMRPLLAQRGQRFEAAPLDALPQVSGDHDQLVQVLVNLLANAQRHGPEGSAIDIGGEQRDGDLHLWIEDRGPGVAAAESASIFDRFHRAATAEGEGVGLGLWIAKSIVEAHGGTITVVSPPGGGARFLLRFPPETLA